METAALGCGDGGGIGARREEEKTDCEVVKYI
jgi:hypothetical protein